ncbi:MAG: hypothetical protein JWN40_95 [Phycisphaerales bacterium]|nr:hypothetical protein [Phycisphaerales bacterium]
MLGYSQNQPPVARTVRPPAHHRTGGTGHSHDERRSRKPRPPPNQKPKGTPMPLIFVPPSSFVIRTLIRHSNFALRTPPDSPRKTFKNPRKTLTFSPAHRTPFRSQTITQSPLTSFPLRKAQLNQHFSTPVPSQCPKKSRNVPNPPMHSPAANRTHRPALLPFCLPPTAYRLLPPLYIHPQPCYTRPNNCQSLRLSLPEDPFQNPFNQAHQLSHSSCRVKPSGFPVFRWVQYGPLHLRKSVSNGF